MFRKKRRLNYNSKFNKLLQGTLGKFMLIRYRVDGENLHIFKKISPPYIILPNHVNFWDPFFISTYVPEPVYYVTSDAHFKNPAFKHLLQLVGAIPKTKFVSDFETVKNIFHIKQRGGVIGIFPEGMRSWDGHTLPLLYSTAKLIKVLKIPVIVTLLKGAYLSLPRWTRRRRIGRVRISFELGFTAREIGSLSVDKIYQKATHLLEYDEYEYQKKSMIPFEGKSRAEYLELTLFICPHCRSIGILRSRRNRFFCTGCGYTTYYNRYGFLEKRSEKFYFETVREWNLWQLSYLRSFLAERKGKQAGGVLFHDKQVWLWTGYKRNPLRRFRFGRLALYHDRAEFKDLNREKIIFPLDEVVGVNVQNKEILEFFCRDVLYSFHFINRRTSSYKWMNALNML